MEDFAVQNTIVAKSLTYPVVNDTFRPTLSSPNLPGDLAFTNFVVISAYYTQIGQIVSFGIKFTADVVGTLAGQMGTVLITPPVFPIAAGMPAIGISLSPPPTGLFGNMGSQGTNMLVARFVNIIGVYSEPAAPVEMMGSYVVG